MLSNLQTLKDLRVLVVDDNIDSLILTRMILEEYAVQVTTVESAREALKVFSELKPDVLLSDIAMPAEDGYSLIRKIRSFNVEQGGQIPAIALTASAREEERTLSLDAGFQRHVSKPVEPDKLVEVILGLLSLGEK